VLDRLADLLARARETGTPIVHVQHHEPAGSDVFAPGTPAVETMPEVAPADGEPVIVKHLPGSFDGTELAEILSRLQARTVVIGGFMTHMCCDTTARQAAARGLEVVFLTDGTGTRDLLSPAGATIPRVVVQETTLAAQADGFSTLADVATVGARLTTKP
jgi:nicotinamidase-related amidase